MNNYDNIKEIRERLGLTQDQFGQKLGLTREMVNLMENGKRNVSKATAILISNLINDVNRVNDDVNYNEAKARHDLQGYNPSGQDLTESLTRSNSGVSYAILELVCRAVSVLEKTPLDVIRQEANQLAHERLTTIENLARKFSVLKTSKSG